MPDNESIFGFANRWYKDVLRTAQRFKINEENPEIRVVTAPYFLGTKFEAFKGRGEGDFGMSHDLEDLISVVDGRATIVEEVASSKPELKAYVGSEFGGLLANDDFRAALPGFLLPDPASQRRITGLLEKLTRLASAASTGK